jgi:hypothetical protein
MMHAIRVWLILTASAAVLLASSAPECHGGDGPTLTNLEPVIEAVPEAPAADEELPAPTPVMDRVMDRPAPFVLPPPPNYSGNEHGWIGGPLLNRPQAAPSGLFFNVESSVVWAHVSNELVGGTLTLAQTSGVATNSNVGLPPGAGMPITGDLIKFPGNRLDATVTPRFELGYRLPDGFGELKLGYRFLDTSGSDTLTFGDLGPAAQKGRLDVNFVDLDYGMWEFSLGPDWEMRWFLGLRYATAFFDSQVAFLHPVTVTSLPFGTGPFTRLSESEAEGSWHIGAHGVLEVGRKLWLRQLTLFGRLEGAGMWGRVHQTFLETFVEAPGATRTSVRSTLGSPSVATQVGLSWDLPNWNHSRFLIGYQFEKWWQLGRGNNDFSFGTLDDQGIFLRAEFNF